MGGGGQKYEWNQQFIMHWAFFILVRLEICSVYMWSAVSPHFEILHGDLFDGRRLSFIIYSGKYLEQHIVLHAMIILE